jgi:hypothetical protein
MIAAVTRGLRRAGVLCAVLAGSLLLVAPAGAASNPARIVATIQLPRGAYDLRAGLGAMWALTVDEASYSRLYRIDPRTNLVTEAVPLGFPGSGLALGYGSVWVSDYYGNRLYRLSPQGAVQAVIPVGLQPQWLHIAFGSVWTSNHHGHSLTRVDPNTDGVVATVRVGAPLFRNGPQDMTDDGRFLYVASSNLPYLQRVDPTTESVRNLSETGIEYGGELEWVPPPPIGGTIWNNYPHVLLGYDVLGSVRVRVRPDTGDSVSGLSYLDGLVFFGENIPGLPAHALLRGVDPVSGERVVQVPIRGRVGAVSVGFGDLWEVDQRTGVVQRVRVALSSPVIGGQPVS